jgi:hypothetical protein
MSAAVGQWIAHDAKTNSFNKFFNLFAVQWILLCNFATGSYEKSVIYWK